MPIPSPLDPKPTHPVTTSLSPLASACSWCGVRADGCVRAVQLHGSLCCDRCDHSEPAPEEPEPDPDEILDPRPDRPAPPPRAPRPRSV